MQRKSNRAKRRRLSMKRAARPCTRSNPNNRARTRAPKAEECSDAQAVFLPGARRTPYAITNRARGDAATSTSRSCANRRARSGATMSESTSIAGVNKYCWRTNDDHFNYSPKASRTACSFINPSSKRCLRLSTPY